MNRTFLIAAAALLTGCSTFNSVFDRERIAEVEEVKRLPTCGVLGQGPVSKLYYLESTSDVAAWAQERSVPLTDFDAKLEGPFVLIELGERGLEGYGVLISKDAVLHSGGRLVLESTFFYAPQVPGRPTQASPCVLVGLPPASYHSIELYDQQGVLRAQTSTTREKK